MLLIEYNKEIESIKNKISKLNQTKNRLMIQISDLKPKGADRTLLLSSDKNLINDLEEIKAKNRELEDKIQVAKTEINHKTNQFDNVKKQIDKDFENHVI